MTLFKVAPGETIVTVFKDIIMYIWAGWFEI